MTLYINIDTGTNILSLSLYIYNMLNSIFSYLVLSTFLYFLKYCSILNNKYKYIYIKFILLIVRWSKRRKKKVSILCDA
ncbi:hypothetical protein PFAG_01234 [Plasmodium falciparum Santa Lucia]|uniref:Uncharacterized protein n=4 Tax=Plasmodium falciparum TaxID=5833 RepID=W7K9U1_PLAFO|nr:hypothetical protein PFTANZ_01324 [Plasmodium falciparum Tanzania (2000708)]EUR75526.1 hypothetical protein PFBG_01269 [Plasmodium falciparum 7G8]EUT90032.1 hypothetical protein PFAG_01234 [Plasmodium falciparum Santa Lucia]EWC89750.1 hypothetical protein PFNF54_01329 [Plasmodium falciparum NF54]